MNNEPYPQPALQAPPQQGAPMSMGGPQQPQQQPPMGPQQPQQPMDPQTAAQIQQMQAQGLDPETIRALLQVQQSSKQTADAQRQRALAKELRGNAAQQLQGRDTGKFYVGPTWVNMLANVAQQRRAGQEEQSAKATDAKTTEDRQKATEALIREIQRGNSGGGYAGP